MKNKEQTLKDLAHLEKIAYKYQAPLVQDFLLMLLWAD